MLFETECSHGKYLVQPVTTALGIMK